MASYRGEWSPGYYNNNSVYQTSPDFKIYSVKAGDNSSNNPDYANWFKMIPYGAPYVDINKNGQYDQDIDTAFNGRRIWWWNIETFIKSSDSFNNLGL
jgi:hypothetical protein